MKKGNHGSAAAQGRRGGHSALVPRRHGGTERRLREFLVLQIPAQTGARVQRAEKSDLLFEREAEGDPVWWPESDPDGASALLPFRQWLDRMALF